MSHKDKNELEQIIENQINETIKIRFDSSKTHPLRVIQASKALIGLNLESPNQKLIDFNDLYLHSLSSDYYKTSTDVINDLEPVVSLQNLEDELVNKNREAAISIFNQIKLVSSEVHILEFLIEISLKQTGKSFLNIWSIYKSVMFLKDKNIDKFINVSVDAILEDDFRVIKNNYDNVDIENLINLDFTIDSIDLYAHLYEVYKIELIRSDNIRKLIGIFVSEHFQNNEKASLIDKELLKYPQLLSKGRSFLLDIIDKKECKLTPDLILFLDSVRTLFRFVNKKNHDIIVYQLESKLENFNV